MTLVFEFISTHISGDWHLAALQGKECDCKSKGKVTPASVITLGCVCVLCVSIKGFEFSAWKKPNAMAILNLCQLLNRLRGQTYQGLYCCRPWGSTHSMCTLCDITQRGENCVHTVLLLIHQRYILWWRLRTNYRTFKKQHFIILKRATMESWPIG